MSEEQHQSHLEQTDTASPAPQGVWGLYKQSLKPNDSMFNNYLARPLAAPLVFLFAKTRVTPNQITFISTLIMLAAALSLASVPGSLGLTLGVIGIELSYIFDCVDGQLARVTGRSSEVGGELDFMMDELKAYMLLSAIGARGAFIDSAQGWRLIPDVWPWSHELWPLLSAMIALLITASAITLTKFIRSEGYALATGSARQRHGQSAGERKSGGPLWPIKMVARLITQYPASLPLFVITGALDLFLYAYGVLHLLYVAQASLGILIQLGRFAPQQKASNSEAREQR